MLNKVSPFSPILLEESSQAAVDSPPPASPRRGGREGQLAQHKCIWVTTGPITEILKAGGKTPHETQNDWLRLQRILKITHSGLLLHLQAAFWFVLPLSSSQAVIYFVFKLKLRFT